HTPLPPVPTRRSSDLISPVSAAASLRIAPRLPPEVSLERFASGGLPRLAKSRRRGKHSRAAAVSQRAQHDRQRPEEQRAGQRRLDRKSTRLNSSHRTI